LRLVFVAITYGEVSLWLWRSLGNSGNFFLLLRGHHVVLCVKRTAVLLSVLFVISRPTSLVPGCVLLRIALTFRVQVDLLAVDKSSLRERLYLLDCC